MLRELSQLSPPSILSAHGAIGSHSSRWDRRELTGGRARRLRMEERLSRDAPLPFDIELVDGSAIKTVGDVERYLRNLKDDQRESSHWEIATRMFLNATRQPAYLRAAALSLQTAMMLDGLLVRMSSPDPRE